MFENARDKLRLSLLRARVDQVIGHIADSRKKVHAWEGYRKFRVLKKVVECRDVCSFYLAPHDGKPLPFFKPGQFLRLRHRNPELAGENSKELIRCYSLSESFNESGCYRVSIKRVPPPPGREDVPSGLMSNYFHDNIEKGDIVDAMAPSGKFFLDTGGSAPIVLVSIGIGITPILSMLNSVIHSGSQREVWLFLGFRCEKDHPFRDHLMKCASENGNIHLHVCYSNPGPGGLMGQKSLHHERVSAGLLKRFLPSSNYQFYVCGSGEMVAEITEGLKSWGVPEDDIKSESFGFSKTGKRGLAPSSGNRAGQAHASKISRGRLVMTPFKSLGTVKWNMVWTKPREEPGAERRDGAPAEGEKFLGWLVVSQRPGWRAIASFNASGRFLRGSLSPKNEMSTPLRNLLSELVGKEIETAVGILQGHMKRERKKAEALDVPVWLELFEAFPAVKADSASCGAMLNGECGAEDRVTVVFSKSKKILKWDSSSGSLLDFAHRNGVSIDSGCRSGNCGTCLTAMKKGDVTYLQAPGTDPQEGSCLTCISVPKENLTLYA